MIAAVFAGLVLVQSPLEIPQSAPPGGDWLVVSVARVIAPDQHPGACFIQAMIEQVVRGRAFHAGEPIGLSLACRDGARASTIAARPEVPTIEALRARKRALAHVDAGGRVIDNGYYGLGAEAGPGG